MTYRTLYLIAVLVLSGVLPARAQVGGDFKKVGTTGMVILELPVNPRSMSLGDSRAADATISGDALFSNPAMLGFAQQRHLVTASHMSWIADTQIQTAGYALNVGAAGTFGISMMRVDMGTMQGTTNAAEGRTGSFRLTDTFSAGSSAFGLTYARQMTDRFSFSGTLRYVNERIADYSADALAIDIGMMYYTGFRSFRIGGLVQNFGSESRYLGDPFKLPILFRLGSAIEVVGQPGAPGRLTVSFEAIHPNNDRERLHLSMEYVPVEAVSLRSGYRLGYDEDGLTAGVGLQIPGRRVLAVDFAYAAYGRLGHTVGFALRAGL